MKIMGLDYGEARTGVALSDELGMMAHGLESIEHKGNDKKLLERICEIIKANKVSKIVIGYPLNMNATKGPRVEKTDAFIKKLDSISCWCVDSYFINSSAIFLISALVTT